MYSAYAVANAFIERALDGRLRGLTSMKLQKLMFFAQAWHLKVKETPLFEDTFVRGTNGPVLPSIQHQLKMYGTRPIGQKLYIPSGLDDILVWTLPDLPVQAVSCQRLVDAIVDYYGEKSEQTLSDLTHLPNSAWSQGPVDGGPIPNDALRQDETLSCI